MSLVKRLCSTALAIFAPIGTGAIERHKDWPKVRKVHLKKEPVCQACGTTRKLEVHHILPVSCDPALELEPTNLITLCDPCHYAIGHLYCWSSYNPEVRDDAMWFLHKVMTRPPAPQRYRTHNNDG